MKAKHSYLAVNKTRPGYFRSEILKIFFATNCKVPVQCKAGAGAGAGAAGAKWNGSTTMNIGTSIRFITNAFDKNKTLFSLSSAINQSRWATPFWFQSINKNSLLNSGRRISELWKLSPRPEANSFQTINQDQLHHWFYQPVPTQSCRRGGRGGGRTKTQTNNRQEFLLPDNQTAGPTLDMVDGAPSGLWPLALTLLVPNAVHQLA